MVVVVLLMAVLLGGCAAPDGAELFVKEGCVNCHRLRGVGGSIGPDLTEVFRRRSEDFVRQQIREPLRNDPHSVMPSFGHLSDREVEALLEYLRQGPPPEPY
jgi:cbb3-type cytochrome oxidase cytochrome c subunit